MTVLVIGARGSIGKQVLAGLRQAGGIVRASSRDPQPGEFPHDVEVVRADLAQPASFPPLLAGVGKVFLYANGEAPETLAEAARKAGVEQVVLLSSYSVLLPQAEKNPIALMHRKVEQALERSGLAWTFLRVGYLATNTLQWKSIRKERVLRTAFPEGSGCLVHERDVAEIAVRALTEDSHRQKAYLIPGAGPLTVRQQVAAIAQALEEPVRLQKVDIDTYRAELLSQVPENLADRLIQFQGNIPQAPVEAGGDAVPELLGRPALSYAEWAQEHANDFR